MLSFLFYFWGKTQKDFFPNLLQHFPASHKGGFLSSQVGVINSKGDSPDFPESLYVGSQLLSHSVSSVSSTECAEPCAVMSACASQVCLSWGGTERALHCRRGRCVQQCCAPAEGRFQVRWKCLRLRPKFL